MADEVLVAGGQLRRMKSPPAPEVLDRWQFEDGSAAVFEDGSPAELED